MKLRLLLCTMSIIMLTLFLPLHAGNSIFSYHGTPCQNYGNDVYGMSMGDVGVSDVFRKNTGYGNPAMLGNATKTLFSSGLLFGWTNYASESATSSKKTYKDNSLDFPYFSVAIPYRAHHFGFQFNSLASGVIKNQTTFTYPTSTGTNTVTEKQSINEYIYRADLIYAYNYKNFNVGLGLDYYFGHDNRSFRQNAGFGVWTLNSEGDSLFNTIEVLEKTFKNPSATLGVTAQFTDLSIGAYFTKGCTLKGESIRSSIHESENPVKIEHIIPNHIALGLTKKMMAEYKISSDFQIDLWKAENQAGYTQDSWKIGVGIAQEPADNNRRTLLGQMPKRLGFSYRQLPFEVNNNTVTETALTAGITLPIKLSDNRLDFGVQYLWRGNLAENNLQDRSLMFMIGLTGFDVLSKGSRRTAPREIPEVEEITE